MSTPNIYGKTKTKSPEEHFAATTARIKQIRSQLEISVRSFKLQDKVCIITGVGSVKGIGRAAALRFAHEGAKHLYLIDFDGKNFPELKSTLKKKYPDVKATTLQADATDEVAIKAVCEQAIQEEGRLDVFFANAGIVSVATLSEITSDQFMNMLRVNGLSCFLAIKHASAAMRKTNPTKGKTASGGSIILTASVAGVRSGGGPLHYSASKAAVNSMANTSAYQLQQTDIRVNSICPGLIETGMTEEAFEYARCRGSDNKIGQLNALGRYGVAEEIATVAAFLASDDASYINGQNIAVDGGLSASLPVVPGRWA